jgi:hypothetical protein
MNKKIIGIFVSTLLVSNVSVVLGIHEEQVNLIEKTESFVFVNPLNQKVVKYIILDTKTEREIPRGKISETYDNFAPNPSFEEGNDMPTGWECYSDYPSKFLWDSEFSHSGEKSVGIKGLEKPFHLLEWTTTDLIPVEPLEYTYELSAWYKYIGEPVDNQYAGLGIWPYDENKQTLHVSCIANVKFSLEWNYGRFFTSWINTDILQKTKYVKLILLIFDVKDDEPNPLVEVRFDDVFFGFGESNPPNKPEIPSGSNIGIVGKEYTYSSSTIEPDGDKISYFFDWGDGSNSGWIGWKESGEEVSASHNWTTKGNYQIKVKARDGWHVESVWSDSLPITVPCSYNKLILQFLELLFQQSPHAFPLLRQLLRY